MYGNNNLVIDKAKVPFFVKNKNIDYLTSGLSYSQIGKIIARDFGFDIINPNEEDNIFYIHGNNIDFPYDYIKYRIRDNGDIIQIEKNNTTSLK